MGWPVRAERINETWQNEMTDEEYKQPWLNTDGIKWLCAIWSYPLQQHWSERFMNASVTKCILIIWSTPLHSRWCWEQFLLYYFWKEPVPEGSRTCVLRCGSLGYLLWQWDPCFKASWKSTGPPIGWSFYIWLWDPHWCWAAWRWNDSAGNRNTLSMESLWILLIQ